MGKYMHEEEWELNGTKYVITGEVRHPKKGEVYLSSNFGPTVASENFSTSRYHILKPKDSTPK